MTLRDADFDVVRDRGSIEGATQAEAPLSGYLTVWAVCAGAALLAALALLAAPRHAFSDTRDQAADVPS